MPEYNNHGDVLNRYWDRLTEELPDFQFHVLDGEELVARARSIPIRWDGTVEDLSAGIDGAIARGFDEGGANALCLRRKVRFAYASDFPPLSHPVDRGSRWSAGRKHQAATIGPYGDWRRDDGFLFDPWMRVHERLGAQILKPEPRSLRITGTVAEWQEWTNMTFPESGDYWFPHGLATLAVDADADRGSYWEPNVWMRHSVS